MILDYLFSNLFSVHQNIFISNGVIETGSAIYISNPRSMTLIVLSQNIFIKNYIEEQTSLV